MALEESTYKNACNLLLHNGTDAQGNVKTKSQSIGALKPDAWDAQKAYNIAQLMEVCLDTEVYRVNHVENTYLNDEE